MQCSPAVIEELKRIITESEVTREDDNQWPEPDRVGEQNLEVKIGNGACVQVLFEETCVVRSTGGHPNHKSTVIARDAL